MVDTNVESTIVTEIADNFLPEVCQPHVCKRDIDRSYQMVDQGEYVYMSWTFYNDERVRLKARVHRDDLSALFRIRLEPLCDDLEEWQADAIMRCEAGTYTRPRPRQGELF